MRRFAFLMVSVFVLFGAAAQAVAKGDGAKMLDKLNAQKAVIDSPKLAAYVSAVGKRVAANSDCAFRHFQFVVIDDASVNAFTTQDDFIFVHRGLLAFLKREDQLAAVLGHEIGHACRQHIAQDQQKVFATNLLAFIGGILTMNGDIQQTISSYGSEHMSSLGREHELEADHYGAIYAAHAGYDPDAMLEVLEILKDQSVFGKKVTGQYEPYHGLFASHPQEDVRLQEVIATAHNNAPAETNEPVDDYLGVLAGLTYGNAGSTGAVRGQRYYHGRLGFVLEFPDKWAVAESADKIIGYPPGGALAGFVAMQIDAVAEGMTPEKYLTTEVKNVRISGGEKIKVQDDKRTHDGYIAHVVTPANTPGASEVGVVFKDGRAHVFRGETRDPKLVDDLRKGFRYAIDHLHTISYADLKKANTETIVLYEAQPGDTYELLAKSAAITENAADQLRLLNGDYPNGEPRAGDRIKLVH